MMPEFCSNLPVQIIASRDSLLPMYTKHKMQLVETETQLYSFLIIFNLVLFIPTSLIFTNTGTKVVISRNTSLQKCISDSH